MSHTFDNIPAGLYRDLLYICKKDQADCYKRFKANVKVTWNHLAYFFKHFRFETPKSLAEHLIRHLQHNNQNPSSPIHRGMIVSIQLAFNDVYKQVQDPNVEKRFEKEVNKYLAQGGPVGSKKKSASASVHSEQCSQKELHLDDDITEWDLKQIESCLNNRQIDSIIFPLLPASVSEIIVFKKLNAILKLIANQPHKTQLHIPAQQNASELITALPPAKAAQFYTYSDKASKAKILAETLAECDHIPISTGTFANTVFSALEPQDLKEATELIFNNCEFPDRVNTFRKWFQLICKTNDFCQNLEKIRIVFETLGTEGDNLLSEVLDWLREFVNASDVPARAELSCFKFYYDFEKLTTDKDRIELLSSLLHSPDPREPGTYPAHNRILVRGLAESCEAKHCPTILQALHNYQYNNKTEITNLFLQTIKERPTVVFAPVDEVLKSMLSS